eukprot:2327119-Pyramimonas_sp.AAC.1
MSVEARVDTPISPHCYVEIKLEGLRDEPFVWVEAPPRAFPLADQEAKRKAREKAKSAKVTDLTSTTEPPMVPVLDEWQLDAPVNSVEDAAAMWFKAAEKYL